MPRKYERKFRKHDENELKQAVEEIQRGAKINTIAKKYSIPRGTLRGRLKNFSKTSTTHHRQVFTNEQEVSLKKYLQVAAAISKGLSNESIRKLVYDYAVTLKKEKQLAKVPESWRAVKHEKTGYKRFGAASKDWLYCFMNRHPGLSLNRPKLTAEHNLAFFFAKLKEENEMKSMDFSETFEQVFVNERVIKIEKPEIEVVEVN